MWRIVKPMISSTRNLAEMCHYNFERAISVSFRWAQKVPEIQMLDEVVFYETTVQACQGRESTLTTSIIGIDLPRSQQYSMGATRPLLLCDIGSD
jgi:hypothetical protein